MPRFLIEVPHESSPLECLRAVQVMQQSGSHFITGAEYGCGDGIHKAWVMVDVDDRNEARALLPPLYRSSATVVQLNRFTVEEIDALLRQHSTSRPGA
jgi:hypothetical protein